MIDELKYDLMKEIDILYRYDRPPHIITLKAIHKDDKRMYFVFELLCGGELFDPLLFIYMRVHITCTYGILFNIIL